MMMKLKKQRNRNHWTLPYAYAGRQSEVHVWLEEAAKLAHGFTHGGALL